MEQDGSAVTKDYAGSPIISSPAPVGEEEILEEEEMGWEESALEKCEGAGAEKAPQSTGQSERLQSPASE